MYKRQGLYHFNGSNGAQNNTFLDSSSNGFTVTRAGNTTQGTFSPFSADEGKWSANFSGSEYFEFNNSDFAFGTGDFTIELWMYYQWQPSYGLFSGGTPHNQVIGPALSPYNSGQGWQIYHGTSETNLSNTGLSNLQLPSLIAVAGFFLGGLVMTWFILPYILTIGS